MNENVGIKRLDHVCWAVRELDDALPMLTEALGMRVVNRWQSDEQGYRGVSLEVPGGGADFELLAPLGEDGFLSRFLRERGPGLHHLAFEVEEIDRAARAISDQGIEPFRGVRRSGGWAETYIHPRDSGGVLFQFFTDEDRVHEGERPDRSAREG
jgi:methylmalonyl-CoA epimerase